MLVCCCCLLLLLLQAPKRQVKPSNMDILSQACTAHFNQHKIMSVCDNMPSSTRGGVDQGRGLGEFTG